MQEGCDLRRKKRIYILVQTCKAECTDSSLLFHIYFRNGKQNTNDHTKFILPHSVVCFIHSLRSHAILSNIVNNVNNKVQQ